MTRLRNPIRIGGFSSFGINRSLAKTLTYGVMHFVVAMSVTFALTGSLAAAIGVGIIEPLVQTYFYNLHEKLWSARDRRAQAAAA